MKRIVLSALAVAAIASCTKNEVIPETNELQEITYHTIETKAATAFDTGKRFISYAWFLPKGQNWATNNSTSSLYIPGTEIYFQTNRWKAATSYYWPKQGSLTFFAWTNNTSTPSLVDATVACSNTQGITVNSYDITKNANVDFLVADVAADQRENTSSMGSWEKGVPTVFKHALSKLIFVVETVKNGTEYNYDSDKVTFNVKSIKLSGVNNMMAYAQVAGSSTHSWTNPSPQVELNEVLAFSNTPTKATSTGVTLSPGAADYYIVIPQSFDDDDILTINYEIITEFVTGKPVTENVTQSVKLSTIYTDGWKATQQHTLTISLGIDEILWDPAQTDWTDGADGSVSL